MAMKRFFVCFLLSMFGLDSCKGLLNQEERTEWVIKYEVMRADGKISGDYVQCLVTTPWSKTNDYDRFQIKDYWTQEFHPFYSGDLIRTIIDSPNLDTYIVRLWIRKAGEESFQLFHESWNQTYCTLP